MRVIRRAGRWLSVALLAGAFSLPMATDPVHAASCATLKKEFTKQIRPTILRLAKKEFHLSNWYHATLKKQQSGKYPTLADFKATHTLMLAKCKSRSDKSSCTRFANQMNAASRRVFNVNKRWAAAGCPGQLAR